MPSDYPGAVDNAATSHADIEDGLLAVQTELGVNPSGEAATVAARLAATVASGQTNTVLYEQTTAPPAPADGVTAIWIKGA